MKKQNILTLSHEYQMDKTQIIGKGSTGEVYLGKIFSYVQASNYLPVNLLLSN